MLFHESDHIVLVYLGSVKACHNFEGIQLTYFELIETWEPLLKGNLIQSTPMY